jgi:glycosyltransferase involved in cell wall biosynthesis
MFAAALSPDYPEPEDLRDIPHPRIGFFGLIHDWWNIELMAEVARRRPDWSFVFVGKSDCDHADYCDISNMHFVGQRKHEELPGYCRGFDVGIIPHKINKLTLNMNPIKLREYLAAGLPVVAAPLPEVEGYEPDVRVAESADEWIAALQQAIADRRPDLDLRRSGKVSVESWSSRVETILDALNDVRHEKRTGNAGDGR